MATNERLHLMVRELRMFPNVAQDSIQRVLVVTPQPFYQDRGTPIAVRNLIFALRELGFEVDVLAFPFGETLMIPGVRIIRCANPFRCKSVGIGFSWCKLLLDASLWQAFERQLDIERYVAVHAVEEAAYMAAHLCSRYKVPFVYDMASAIPVELSRHPVFGIEVIQRCLRLLERHVLHKATHVVCSAGLSRYVNRSCPEISATEWRFPVEEPKAANERAASLRAQLDISPQHRVIVYCGNFAQYQGIDLLFDAFQVAWRRDPRLTLVCVGATATEREQWYARFPPELRAAIKIETRRPRHEISSYIAMGDCLVSLRVDSGNFPLKGFEYMRAGKPIVANRGPAHEPILNSERAYLCDLTPQSIAAALLQAVHNEARSQALAHAAKQYAKRHFSWDAFVNLVSGVYTGAVQREAVSRHATL